MKLAAGTTVHAVVERVVSFGVFFVGPNGARLLVLGPDLGVASSEAAQASFQAGRAFTLEVTRYTDEDGVQRCVKPVASKH